MYKMVEVLKLLDIKLITSTPLAPSWLQLLTSRMRMRLGIHCFHVRFSGVPLDEAKLHVRDAFVCI